MRILVTGSSGFLGTHLIAAAYKRGWIADGADCRAVPYGAAYPNTFTQCGYGDMPHLRWSDAKRYEVVVHFAGYSSLNGFDDALASNFANNVSNFNLLLERAYEAGVRKVVYASSSAVYTDGINTSFREDEPIDYTRLKSHYGKSKLMDEMLATSYADAFGMNVLGLRYFNVYGPGDERKGNRCAPIQHFVNARAKGEPIKLFFDGNQAKDFIYVSDAIEITMRLIEADAKSVYNVGTGKATSFNDAAEIIGGPVEYAEHPSPFGYQFFTQSDNTKLLSTIGGYNFMSLEDGVKKMVAA